MKQINLNYDKLIGLAILEHPIYQLRHSLLQTEINANKSFKKDLSLWRSESSIIKKEKKNYKIDKELCKEIIRTIVNSVPKMNLVLTLTNNYYE